MLLSMVRIAVYVVSGAATNPVPVYEKTKFGMVGLSKGTGTPAASVAEDESTPAGSFNVFDVKSVVSANGRDMAVPAGLGVKEVSV